MRIYVFAEHYPNPYKPYFDTEFSFLLRQGHELSIFAGGQYTSTVHPKARQYRLAEKTRVVPTTLRTLPSHAPRIIRRLLLSPLVSANRVRRVFDRRMSLKTNLLRILRALTLPDLCPDLCYVHNIATADTFDFLGAIYPESRHVMYFHGGEIGGVARVKRDRQLFNSVDVVFTNTTSSRAQAIQRGCDPDRVVISPVGFDLDDFPDDRPKRYLKDGVCRIISVGRLSEEKGLLYALDAIALLVARRQSTIHYTIVGRGTHASGLKQYVLEKNLAEYVDFAGEKTIPQITALLSDADVLILPSLVTETWAETQACVVQEAMMMRTLVISTNTGGVPECRAGILDQFSVSPGDANAIAEAVERICRLTEQEMVQIGSAARDFTRARFDIEMTGRAFLERALAARMPDEVSELRIHSSPSKPGGSQSPVQTPDGQPSVQR